MQILNFYNQLSKFLIAVRARIAPLRVGKISKKKKKIPYCNKLKDKLKEK